MIHQSPNSGLNSGLQIEKEGYKRTLSHRYTLLNPVWPNLVYKLRIFSHNIWDSYLGVSFRKFISFWKQAVIKAELLKKLMSQFWSGMLYNVCKFSLGFDEEQHLIIKILLPKLHVVKKFKATCWYQNSQAKVCFPQCGSALALQN